MSKTFIFSSVAKDDPHQKLKSGLRKLKRRLFEPEGSGDKRVIEFEISSLAAFPEVQTPEEDPENSIVLVRDMQKLFKTNEHVDIFNRFLVEIRTWDSKLKSFELAHYGLRDARNEDLKSMSQIVMLASVAGFKNVYEVPACYGTSTFLKGVMNEKFLLRNEFKKLA